MNPFKTRKPRRFNHPLIYSDERRERLQKLEERVKRQLEMSSSDKFDVDSFREVFAQASAPHKHQKTKFVGWGQHLSYPVILILIVSMFLLMHYLMSGTWLI